MANSDKNIRITTSKNKTTYPNIVFTGSAAGSSVITLEVLDDNTLSFTSNEGQVFSIDSNLSSGTIWAVSDISGVPMLSSSAGGTVGLAVYGGIVGIGQTNPLYKLDLKGSFGLASSNDGLYNFIFSNSAASGSNSLQIRSANSLLLYNSGNTFYTGFKSRASADKLYLLPATDGSSGQFLQTDGAQNLTWATATGGGGGSGATGVNPGGQYQIGYYASTGASIDGSSTFTNNTSTGVISIGHATVSTSISSGALQVSGGVGIGGSLFVGGTGSSISGLRIASGTITAGTWNGTVIGTQYGGLGANFASASGILTISGGTVSNSTTSSAISSALSDETGSGSLVFGTQPSFGTGVTTGSATFAVFNTNATTINAFGAATAISLGASTGTATFNSTNDTTAVNTGAVVFSGGVGIGRSVSVGGRLLLFNGSTYTGFVSAQVGTGSTVYTLPTTSPATGSSILQSTSDGVMSWVPLVASGGAGSGTVAIPGAQYQIAAYYSSATGASVSGSSTFTNNTATSQVAITHNTVSTSTSTGALAISGGLGLVGNAFIGGTISVPSTSTSNISNVLFTNGVVNSGAWSATAITSHYGGTGLQTPFVVGDILYATSTTAWGRLAASSTSGQVLTSNGASALPTWQAVPPAAASSVAVAPTTVNASFFVTAVNTSSSSGLGLSTITSFVVNPSTGIVSLSGLAVTNNTATTTTTSGALVVSGGFGLAGNAFIGGTVYVPSSTASNFSNLLVSNSTSSTSTSTGALVSAGGVGIAGNAFIGGTFVQQNSTSSVGTNSGSMSIAGGMGLAGNAFIGGTTTITNTTASVGSDSGALVIRGGVGIGQSVSVGGSLNIFNGANYSGFRFAGSADTTYTLPSRTPTGTATSYLSSSIDGVMAWVAAPTSGGSGSVNSGTATYAAFYATTTNSVSENANLQFTGTGVSIGGRINSTSITSGSFYVYGGVGITGNAFIGGTTTITNTTNSSSTTTGALVIAGGAGIASTLFVGGTVSSIGASIYGIIYTNNIQIGQSGNNINFLDASGATLGNFNTSNGWFRSAQTTSSTSTSTGALVSSGGLGIAGNAFIGGTFVHQSTTSSVGTNSGSVTLAGGIGIAGNAFIGGTITQQNNTSSVGTNSGAITVVGGVGIAGNAFIGGTFVHQSTTSSVGTNSGSVTLAGGIGIAGNAFIGGTFVQQNSTSSVGTNSGSMSIAGGVGIAGNAFIGGTITQQNSTSSVGTNSGAITVVGGVGIAGNAFIGGTTTIQSTQATLSASSGSMVVIGGAAVGQTLSIGGSLNIFNAANYTGFRFAGSANTTYTLPPRTPTGTGTSYLSSSIDGIMAWVAAPSGGGATPGGTNLGDIQYKSGSSFAGNVAFNYSEDHSMLTISNFPASATNSTISALKILGTSQSWSGISLGTFIAVNAATGFVGDLIHVQVNGVSRLQLSGDGYLRIGPTSGTGFTLPILNGTSGQVLTANTNGVASWTTVSGSSSGGTVYAGTANQIAFYGATGNTVGGSATFTNTISTGVVDINHTTESTSTSTGALVVDGGAGIAKSLYVGTTLAVGGAPGYNIPNNLASFVSTVNSYNQLVIQNRSNGATASANLVVNNDVSTDSTFYGEIGMNSSAFSGSGALAVPSAVYVTSTSAPLVLGSTTQHPIRFVVNASATDTLFIDGAGTAISVFTNFDLRSQNKIRFFNSGNTFRTELHAGANTANYALALPTAPVGNGYSTILVDTSGNMFFAPLEGGLATTSVTGNRVVLRNKMEHHVWMSAGYTPLAAGPDNVIYRVPDSSEDGTTDLTFSIKEFTIRVETPSAGSSRIQVERSSTRTGAFTLAATGSSLIGGSGLTISGAGIYLTTLSTFPAGIFVTSGDLLRLNYNLLNATHANFSVAFTLNEV
jgi:hypothetical protein